MIFGRRTKLSLINDEMQGCFVFVERNLDVICEMFFLLTLLVSVLLIVRFV